MKKAAGRATRLGRRPGVASQFREIKTADEACAFSIVVRGTKSDQADARPSQSAALEVVKSLGHAEAGDRLWRVTDMLPETVPICKEEVEVLEIYLGPLFDQLLAKRQDIEANLQSDCRPKMSSRH